MANIVGQSVGRYHILEQLGEGGMATVFKAYDTRLEREVAIKVIRRDAFPVEQHELILKRFEREAKALAKLNHPNIVGAIDYGEYEDSPYLVMPYFPGGTLKARLMQQPGQSISWQEAAEIILPIARALQFAHEQNIIHRDIKASNILLTLSGEPMLSDFGIAKILDNADTSALTGSGAAIGTPEYMAPEQWTGKTSPQSDMYSLGVVFYEMVTGRKPFIADTPAAILLKQVNEGFPLPSQFAPDLPQAVENILLKTLAKNPEDRYADMAAFVKALTGLLVKEGEISPAVQLHEKTLTRVLPVSQPRPKEEARRVRTRSWGTVALAVLLGLALIVGAVWLFTTGPLAASPAATLPPVRQDQIYILRVSKTTMNVLGSDGSPVSAASGEMLTFVPGQTVRVADSASGYVQMIFPGQAEVFFAPGTEVTLLTSDAFGVRVQLEKGRLLVRLPDDFPVGRRFVVQNAFDAAAWVSGSLMGVEEDTTFNRLYVDCLEHECWFSNGASEQRLPGGYHWDGSSAGSLPGTDAALWEFAPDEVAAPTATFAFTPSSTFTPEPNATKLPTTTSTKRPTSIPPRDTDTPVPPPLPTNTPVPPPLPTDTPGPRYSEPNVRYIIADMQLGGVYGYYCPAQPDQLDVAEACSRWDAGIRVENIDQFERIINGVAGWQVVYFGTTTPINGWDVILTP